jgi:hypothetical protein
MPSELLQVLGIVGRFFLSAANYFDHMPARPQKTALCGAPHNAVYGALIVMW